MFVNKFLDFFKTKSVLDEDSIVWLFDTFLWAEQNLDAETFYQKTELIHPDNRFFPGHADNSHDMAQLIFDNVLKYTNLQHWPFRIEPQNTCPTESPTLPYLQGNIRGKGLVEQSSLEQKLIVPYDPQQVKNPQAIIANFTHTLSQYSIMLSPNQPPEVEQNIAQIAEVISVFFGFGIILTNSAFNYRNITCGSCRTPTHDRTSSLSQYDTCYALAIFCHLKKIPKNKVTPSLKGNLRKFFKIAYKQVKNRKELELFV